VGSPHDSATPGFTSEICQRCHAPHDHALATQTYLEGLLWNHELSQATYTLYDSAWSDSIDGVTGQPDGISKMCLGCHDGTVAVGNWGENIGAAGGFMIGGDLQIPAFADGANRDLRGTHPISITYDNVADTGLNDPDTTPMGTSGMISDVLQNGKVQCSSCHDVHDSPGEAVALSHLLRVAQNTTQGGDPSGLCLTCHNK